MFESFRADWLPSSNRTLGPQPLLSDKFTDIGKWCAFERLIGDHSLGRVGRDGEDQFEIFAVRKGVIQRRDSVGALF